MIQDVRVEEVPLSLVNVVWDACENYLESALFHSQGEYNADQAKIYVINGLWNLLVAIDDNQQVHGAAIVQYFNRPNDRVAFMIALGGRLIVGKSNAEKLFNVLRANGATCIEAAGRDEVLRLWKRYGLEKKYTIISTKL